MEEEGCSLLQEQLLGLKSLLSLHRDGCELGSAPQLVENARGVPCAEGSRLLGGASDEFGSWCLGQLLALPLGWLEGAQGWWWHRV